MAEYKTTRPLSQVRLRNWDTGRLSQLKLTVQRLESEVNKSLAASTQQSARRKLNDQVPFVLDLSVVPGFRQATVQYSAPPGLGGAPTRQLLFYEIQHDSTPAFSNPTIIQTPNTSVNLAGFGLGETRSFRVRVVSTLNEVSQWSSTVTVTLAQNKIQSTPLSNVFTRITRGIGEFQTVLDNVFQPVDAKACINIQVALACPHFDVEQKDPDSVVRQTFHGGPASVQLRWIIGAFDATTQDFILREKGVRCLLSARPGFNEEASDFSSIRTPVAFGTFMLPFFKPEAGVNHRVIMQAAKTPGSEWFGPTRARALEISDPILISRQGQIIEVLESL